MRHRRVVAWAPGDGPAVRPVDPHQHLVDVIIQHLAVAPAQLHRHRRPGRRDVEAFDAEVAGLEVEGGDRRRAARHRPEGDGLTLRPAGLYPDALVVLARHDADGVARLGKFGRVLNCLERLLLSSWVSIGRAGGRLVNHARGRPNLPSHASQHTHARQHAACDQKHVFSRIHSRSHYLTCVTPSPTSAAVLGGLPPPASIHYGTEVLQQFPVRGFSQPVKGRSTIWCCFMSPPGHRHSQKMRQHY